jgi:Fe2+ transport system protein B
MLRSKGAIAEILGKQGLRNIGFDVSKNGLTARQVVMLSKVRENLPSTSKINGADEIELETITENVMNSTEDLISLMRQSVDHETTQTDDLFEYPLRELLGLDKELKNIRGSLQVETAKRVKIEQHIEREKNKLQEMENDSEYTDEQRQEVEDRAKRLSGELTVREESINIHKGKLSNQITSIKETITKVMDGDTSLGEKIKTLFREQGITIVSILTAFGMVVGFLVEAILPGGSSTAQTNPDKGGDKKDDAKEWIKNKLKALARLFGRLAEKLGAALPGIIGSIVSWILNRAKEAFGWLSQNLWALILGTGGLIYTYMVTQ